MVTVVLLLVVRLADLVVLLVLGLDAGLWCCGQQGRALV